MSAAKEGTIEQLGHTDPMRREANKGLMVAWINADLSMRAAHDVCKSIVIYDGDKLFLTACLRETWANEDAASLAYAMGGRYWSKGII